MILFSCIGLHLFDEDESVLVLLNNNRATRLFRPVRREIPKLAIIEANLGGWKFEGSKEYLYTWTYPSRQYHSACIVWR